MSLECIVIIDNSHLNKMKFQTTCKSNYNKKYNYRESKNMKMHNKRKRNANNSERQMKKEKRE